MPSGEQVPQDLLALQHSHSAPGAGAAFHYMKLFSLREHGRDAIMGDWRSFHGDCLVPQQVKVAGQPAETC